MLREVAKLDFKDDYTISPLPTAPRLSPQAKGIIDIIIGWILSGD